MSFILPNDMENSDLSPDEKARFLNRVNIRLFRKSDLGDIRRLFEIAFPVSYPDSLFDSIAAQFYKGNKLVTYVAEYLEEDYPVFVGFVMFQSHMLDGSRDHIPNIIGNSVCDHLLYIQNIAILPKYKRHGLGSHLLNLCIASCKNDVTCGGVAIIPVYLHVQASNAGNIHFYEKNGFVKVGVLRNLYLINDQWEDGDLYFYSLHNTIAEYKEVEENLYSPVAFGLTTIVIFSLLVCFFCYIY